MKALLKIIIGVLTLLITILICIKIVDYLSPNYWGGYLFNKQEVFKGIFKIGFYIHISSAPILILIGLFQVLFPQHKRVKTHKALGFVYVFGVLFLSGPSGIILSLFAFGGLIGKTSFLLLSLLWILFTYLGFKSIIKKEIAKHKKWMMRSFTLCFSAIALRLLLFLFSYFFEWNGKEMYSLSAWLSWCIPLISLEFYFRFSTSK